MDDRSFDRLARALGGATNRRTGLKALVGGILGAGGMAALDAGADAKRKGRDKDRDRGADADTDADVGRKKSKTCKPACTGGFECRKVGKKRTCVCQTGVTCGAACCAAGQSCVEGQCRAAACDPPCANGYACEGTTCVCRSGIECGGACCASGQTCQGGICAGQPDPGACIAFGQPCKQTGRACCGGLACGSGQDGTRDVACYIPEAGACERTAQCVFGTECRDGACQPPLPAPPPPPGPVDALGAACDPATNVCTSPGAVCQAYTGEHPIGLGGTYCTLPLGATCTADPDCGCYSCGYAEGSFRSGRRQARATQATVCCGPEGYACTADADCCEDHACTGNVCTAKTGCTVCAGGGCPYATIAAAITDGVTDIRVGAGTYAEHTLPLPPAPTTSLRIRACGSAKPTIDAKDLGRIMAPIPAGMTVTFKGIALKNGSKPGTLEDYGGCFNVEEDGALRLDGVTLSDCDAGDSGGGVYSKGALTVVDSTITRCTSYYGGGIAVRQGSLTVSGSSVTNCTTDGDGGGIWAYGDSDERAALTVAITDSTVADNVADDDEGGGIHVSYAALAMTRVAVTGNRLTERNAYGGGVYLYGTAPSTLTDCTIDNNFSDYYAGGLAIYSTGTVDVVGGSISGNHARYYGAGGVYVTVENTTVTFRDVRIAGNWTVDDDTNGPGVWISCGDGGIVDFTGTTRIEDNHPNPLTTTASVPGGGIYLESGDVTLGPDTVVAGNLASGDGGGIYVETGSLTVEGTIRDNTATANGGGISCPDDGPVTLQGKAVVSGNTAASGGGIWNWNVLTVKDDVEIRGNTATGDSTGGGIYNMGTLLLEGNARVRGNTAAGSGSSAGIFVNAGDAKVECPGSTARVCGNPESGSTGATNCGGPGAYSTEAGKDCTAVCVGGPKTSGSAGSGACPA